MANRFAAALDGLNNMEKKRSGRKGPRHIVLTSHPSGLSKPPAIHWGAHSAKERGPVIATLTDKEHRNCIGTHAGSYSVYRALAIACGNLSAEHRPDLSDTAPVASIGPHPTWFEPNRIISLDPFGAGVAEYFADELKQGMNIQPTIAITQARVFIPELLEDIQAGRLKAGGPLLPTGHCKVTKAAIEPVWHLPGIAKRYGIKESDLRRVLFEQTGGMFPELVTRSDLEVFLPPIGGVTIYIFGDVAAIADSQRDLAVRVHDECNGSDVFGSDICTCRPYLTHGIEVCIRTAQAGGAGVIVYNRKEGRALGEVTKFLVYNARKRQVGGDRAESYFLRTECVAGTQDNRFQQLMPDVLHWLGIRKINHLVSMSDDKYDAIVQAGIEIAERVPIPESMIPDDARVEIDAKKASGYFTQDGVPGAAELAKPKGRKLE